MQKGSNKIVSEILGYMTFYFKAENDEQVAYSYLTTDFSIPPTKEFLIELLDRVKEIYEISEMKVDKVTFCSKEEYEKCSSKDVLINHEWKLD